MGKFDGVLICTDLDGTLLNSDKKVSDENKKAIEFFKNEGGIFTFVTGRMPFFVSEIYKEANPNAPIGCINGGGLYDFQSEKYIWTNEMPKEVMSLVKAVDEKFPDVGIQVNTFYKVYFSKENKTMQDFRKATGLPNITCNYNEVEEPLAKIVFGAETEEEILGIKETLLAHPMAKEFDYIRSEKTLSEILPKGICKGVSITKLAEYYNLDINKTVAIGDYNNDIPMFKAAKIGVAVSNACEEALNAADYITVSNDENAIAQVIYDLYNGKFKKIKI